jgi:hypothetical protein
MSPKHRMPPASKRQKFSHDTEFPTLDASPIRTIPNDYSQYKPISSDQQEIRILVLHPSTNPQDPVACSLIRSHLKTHTPRYEAISYCWGNLDETNAVTIQHLETDVVLRQKQMVRLSDDRVVLVSDIGTISNCWAQYQITKSLHGALLRFRRSDKPRYLWADAICINQGDPAERSHQVRFMRSVYGTASRVLVWLDKPSDPNFDAMEFLFDMSNFTRSLSKKAGMTWQQLVSITYDGVLTRAIWLKFYEESVPTYIQLDAEREVGHFKANFQFASWEKEVQTGRRRLDLDADPSFTSSKPYGVFQRILESMKAGRSDNKLFVKETFQSLNAFFRGQEWFSRIWVLQEVGSNNNVLLYHMNHIIEWECLEALVIMLDIVYHVAFLDIPFRSLPGIWSIIAPGRRRYRLPLVELLGSVSTFQATDGRDKIFAQLGMMTEVAAMDEIPLTIGPDYCKPVAQVFQEFTRWVISSQNNLDLLALLRSAKSCSASGRAPSGGLPSWVPDYRSGLPQVDYTLGVYSPYRASGLSTPQLHHSQEGNVLRLGGFQVQTVSSVIDSAVYGQSICSLQYSGHIDSENPAEPRIWRSLLSKLLPNSLDANLTCRDTESTPNLSPCDILYRYFRCLASTLMDKPVHSTSGRLIRSYSSLEAANISFATYRISLDPQLKGLTWRIKHLFQTLSNRPVGSRMDLTWAQDQICTSLFGRRFFVTPDQDFGLCPRGTKEDDIIVILYGGSTPYVLREKSYPMDMSMADRLRKGPTYQFIGECFLEKYMDGSAVDKAGFAEEGLQRFKYQKKVFNLV